MGNDALMNPVRRLDKCRLWIEVNDNGQKKYSPVPPDGQKNPNSTYF